MKRILFPTDFSEAANNALQIAISLAKQVQAEIVVLHSLNSAQQYADISLSTAGDITMPGMRPDVVFAAIEEEKKRVTNKMETLVSEVTNMGISVQSEIVQPALEHVINEIAIEKKIDFIVMGTHGASGLREAFIGSVAQKVVRLARIPVLTVNANCKDFRVNNVVCCSDFIEEPILRQIPRIEEFVKIFEAKLDLVYINTPTYFEETKSVTQRMSEVVKDYSLENVDTHIYNSFDIDEGVIDFAEMQNADVIAMITHGYRGVKKLFSDNITESVVNHSSIPVLTLHIH
jgi:nucleotide-binding universal stress UspA family protein